MDMRSIIHENGDSMNSADMNSEIFLPLSWILKVDTILFERHYDFKNTTKHGRFDDEEDDYR